MLTPQEKDRMWNYILKGFPRISKADVIKRAAEIRAKLDEEVRAIFAQEDTDKLTRLTAEKARVQAEIDALNG